MVREIKVGDTVRFTGVFGGVYKGEVRAIDGDEAWVLFEGNKDHSTVYLRELKVIFPLPKFKKGDKVLCDGDTGTVITSHINCNGQRFYWVEYDRVANPCWGVREESVRGCLSEAVEKKMVYNESRPRMHGKRV